MGSTILIVDDSEVVLAVTRSTLEGAGYRVLTLAKATGIVSLLIAERPALVLLDVNMPALSGDTIARICSRTARTTGTLVALHSSLEGPALERLVQESGANAFIQKTDNPYAFLRQVRALIGSPRQEDSASATSSATMRVADPVPESRTWNTNVLLVDRDMSLLAQMREMVRELGARAEFALSTAQALDKLGGATPPAATVVSADLPDDGLFRILQRCQKERALARRLIIISSEETVPGLPGDFDGVVITKPLRPATLKREVGRLLDEQASTSPDEVRANRC